MADQFAAFRKSPTGFIAKASKRLTAHLIQGPRLRPTYTSCFVCQVSINCSYKPLVTIRLASAIEADELERLFENIKGLDKCTDYERFSGFAARMQREWPRNNPGIYHRYQSHDYFYYDELGCKHQANLMWDFL